MLVALSHDPVIFFPLTSLGYFALFCFLYQQIFFSLHILSLIFCWVKLIFIETNVIPVVPVTHGAVPRT